MYLTARAADLWSAVCVAKVKVTEQEAMGAELTEKEAALTLKQR